MGTSSPSTAEQQRRTMVHRSIAARGLHNPAVLDAMGTVPRERFVPEHLAGAAYDDRPLPIGGNQTISQPYMVAVMVKEAELTHGDPVGTGSGHGAAALSPLAARLAKDGMRQRSRARCSR